MKKILPFITILFLSGCLQKQVDPTEENARWSVEEANTWGQQHPWYVGCNFIPSTAINQLEMWQKESFDPETIARELDWAEEIGFNMLRVYLHDVLWKTDSTGMIDRMDQFLEMTSQRGMKVMFVLFDDCWYGNPEPGTQPGPVKGLHNSYWLQSPKFSAVTNEDAWPALKHYTQGILNRFGEDERVAVWDLYNEPGNNHHPKVILPLVKEVFSWAWEVRPEQPLTMGVWRWNPEFITLNHYFLEHSDIITFHSYDNYESMKKMIERYQSYERPLICTEYLARGNGSTFQTHLPMMKQEGVGAINWGLVFGKTQTVYPWNTPKDSPVPEVWHHDIFWPDGTPFDQEEVDLIRDLTQ